MSELDDLAAAVQSTQHVPVRRRVPADSRAISVPLVYVAPATPPKPRSAFMAGFLGTFGVIAALLAISIGWAIWKGTEMAIASSLAKERAERVERQRAEERDAEARRQQVEETAQREALYAPGHWEVRHFADCVMVTAEASDADHLLIKCENVVNETFSHIQLTAIWREEPLAVLTLSIGPHGKFERRVDFPGIAARLGGHHATIRVAYVP